MYSISLPLDLPADRSFFSDGYPLPLIAGKHPLSCDQTRGGMTSSDEHFPLLLRLDGFETQKEAEDFLPGFIAALRWASIDMGHSVSPSTEAPIFPKENHFDGRRTAISQTSHGCRGWFATVNSVASEHIGKVGKAIEGAFSLQVPAKFANEPELKLAFELYSDVEFAGGTNAKFIVLISALEIFLPPNKGRGAVIKFVKDTLAADGQTDGKSVGKVLDNLFILRNALLHEAKSVTFEDLKSLREIVGRVLKAKITGTGTP